MKRSIILATLAAVALSVPSIALAGVGGSPHDLTTGTVMVAEDLCFACHIPHNAGSSTLWARDTTGGDAGYTAVQLLCWSCHDGTTVVLGGDTVMDATLDQHTPVGGDCSGTGACHDVHDNTNGTFLAADTTGGNSQCEACHGTDTVTFPNAWGDHTASGNHPMAVGFTCDSCHAVHGADGQTDVALLPGGVTNPILLGDNTSGGYYGAMCIGCHNGAGVDGGGGAYNYPTNTFAYDEAVTDGSEQKHPTIATTAASANWTGTPINGCDNCHDLHNPGSTFEWLTISDNTDAAFCMTCHNGSTGPNFAGGGGGSHYTGVPTDITMNVGATPALPWADQLDDSPKAGFDYASATADEMICQTCHSVHRAGVEGYFLRQTNGTTNAICSTCHVDN